MRGRAVCAGVCAGLLVLAARAQCLEPGVLKAGGVAWLRVTQVCTQGCGRRGGARKYPSLDHPPDRFQVLLPPVQERQRPELSGLRGSLPAELGCTWTLGLGALRVVCVYVDWVLWGDV